MENLAVRYCDRGLSTLVLLFPPARSLSASSTVASCASKSFTARYCSHVTLWM